MSADRPAYEGSAARLRGVTVSFPRSRAASLTVPELTLSPGDQVLVFGPSGAGKSTLLHTISGVVPHTVTSQLTGEVTVCGRPTTDASVVELSRHVAVVGQDPTAGVCLPVVEQELALPLENRATPEQQISPRIDEALADVGAGRLRHRSTRDLSGGESQRVALAASLVARPDVLLLDEPTAMLDPAGLDDVHRAVQAAVAQHRPTVVMVEHRLDELAGERGVAGLPARTVVLDEGGTLIAQGHTAQVLADNAPRLLANGCWLPLDTELLALTGAPGGLAAPANQELLLAYADHHDQTRPVRAGLPALTARCLGVRPEKGSPAVLRGVDLELRTGEITALLGANGAGKSTLLLTLADMLPPAEGEVHGPRPGMVFQNPEHQFVAQTITDEIGHGLGPSRSAVVARQLRQHRLEHLAGHNPFRLSGGEQRRLSLAAMLANDRPVLLLDEPTLGLDRRDAIATLHALRDASVAGAAVLFASHDVRSVAGIADRILVVGDGEVLADGPTHQVLGDGEVLRQAGLRLPPLVAWLFSQLGSPVSARKVLQRLDLAMVEARVGTAKYAVPMEQR